MGKGIWEKLKNNNKTYEAVKVFKETAFLGNGLLENASKVPKSQMFNHFKPVLDCNTAILGMSTTLPNNTFTV